MNIRFWEWKALPSDEYDFIDAFLQLMEFKPPHYVFVSDSKSADETVHAIETDFKVHPQWIIQCVDKIYVGANKCYLT